MTELPASTHAAFLVAASELGMWSAARLFLRELEQAGGVALRDQAVDELGRDFPVLQAVFSATVASADSVRLATEAAVRSLVGARQLVVVGLEVEPMDALVDALPLDLQIGLLTHGAGLEPDARRSVANYGGRVDGVELGELPTWAGRRSALLTFVYGSDGHSTGYVAPLWMRVHGADVRTQFRSLVGWDLLGQAPPVHPRWLSATSLEDFSELIGP